MSKGQRKGKRQPKPRPRQVAPPPPPPKTPLPDNPYHRCFTANRSFEELARARKNPPAGR